MSCNFQQKKALRISESEGGADGPGPRGREGWTESRAGGAGNPTNKHSSRRSLAAATGPDAATHDGQTPARTGAGPGVLPQSSGEKRGRDEGLVAPDRPPFCVTLQGVGPEEKPAPFGGEPWDSSGSGDARRKLPSDPPRDEHYIPSFPSQLA